MSFSHSEKQQSSCCQEKLKCKQQYCLHSDNRSVFDEKKQFIGEVSMVLPVMESLPGCKDVVEGVAQLEQLWLVTIEMI